MNITKIKLSLLVVGLGLAAIATNAQPVTFVWRKLPGITNLPANWNPSPVSVDVTNGIVYSVINGIGWTFNMRSNTFQSLPVSNWPGNLGADTWARSVFDGASSNLFLYRDGASYVYRLPASGGTPVLLGGVGASGSEYQDMWYWNPVSQSVGRFGGYGFFAVKNWRFEFDVNADSWSQIEANSPGRGPWGRTARDYALAADGRSVFLFGGDGNSTGSQGYVDPGFYGNGSTSGQMDALCDLWRLDFTTGVWTNYLAANNYSYPYRGGAIVHFPPLDAVLMVMGWGYTPTNAGVATSGVAIYRLGQDSGFNPALVSGDLPNVADSVLDYGSVFYDSLGQRILYFNQKGVYELRQGLTVNLHKAVYVDFSGLSPGSHYQLQFSPDLYNWTNDGSPFTATNTTMPYSKYWNVENWNSLFFRLQTAP